MKKRIRKKREKNRRKKGESKMEAESLGGGQYYLGRLRRRWLKEEKKEKKIK